MNELAMFGMLINSGEMRVYISIALNLNRSYEQYQRIDDVESHGQCFKGPELSTSRQGLRTRMSCPLVRVWGV